MTVTAHNTRPRTPPPQPDSDDAKEGVPLPFIRTLTGDITSVVGAVFTRAHLADPRTDATKDRASRLAGEQRRMPALGLLTDATVAPTRGDVDRLAAIAAVIGIPIVACTGHVPQPPHHRVLVAGVPRRALADRLVADLTVGNESEDGEPLLRAGIISVATGGEGARVDDEGRIEASVQAHAATGAPLQLRCAPGSDAVVQVEALIGWGVPAESILLSQTDSNRNAVYLIDLAATGVTLEIGPAGHPDPAQAMSSAARTILTLVHGGLGDQIVLSADGVGGLSTQGPALSRLPDVASQLRNTLTRAGLDSATLTKVTTTNASRALSWRPGPDLTDTAPRVPHDEIPERGSKDRTRT